MQLLTVHDYRLLFPECQALHANCTDSPLAAVMFCLQHAMRLGLLVVGTLGVALHSIALHVSRWLALQTLCNIVHCC
jgi:hypothetical protein